MVQSGRLAASRLGLVGLVAERNGLRPLTYRTSVRC